MISRSLCGFSFFPHFSSILSASALHGIFINKIGRESSSLVLTHIFFFKASVQPCGAFDSLSMSHKLSWHSGSMILAVQPAIVVSFAIKFHLTRVKRLREQSVWHKTRAMHSPIFAPLILKKYASKEVKIAACEVLLIHAFLYCLDAIVCVVQISVRIPLYNACVC